MSNQSEDNARLKLRLWLTGFVGLMGFRPPPEPEEIAVMVPGPDLTGAAPEYAHESDPRASGSMAPPPRRKLGAVVNGMELDVDLSSRGKNHVWRDPAGKPPEL